MSGSETKRLIGRRVVVTGAGTGIGRAVAIRMAAEGATLALVCNRSLEAARSLAAELVTTGGSAHVVQADISTTGGVEKVVEGAERHLGGVDVLANVAGATDILEPVWADAGREEQLDRLLAVDVRGTVLLTWAIVDLMKQQGGGCIINTTWDGALGGEAVATAGYNGSASELFGIGKGALVGFTRNLARTAAPSVRVNDVAPGYIGTEYFHDQDGNDGRREFVRRSLSAIPLARLGTVDEVAAAFTFLASDESAYITGQTIYVNGGAYA